MKVGYRSSGGGVGEAVSALDRLKALGSLVWNALQGPMSVRWIPPGGVAVAPDDALAGPAPATLCKLLRLLLEQVELLDRHLEKVSQLTSEAMRGWQDAVARLSEVPGIRILAAQQILAETGPQAAAFPSAAQFVSWIGACPGRAESAGTNHSSRCPKGNRYLRRSLCQAAQAAVRTNHRASHQRGDLEDPSRRSPLSGTRRTSTPQALKRRLQRLA